MENSNINSENFENSNEGNSSFFDEKVSSSNGNEVVPKLRFKEFSSTYITTKLSDFTKRIARKNTQNETDLSLTISSKDGLIAQEHFFNKLVSSKDLSGYYLLKQGEFAYNKSYSVGYDFGSIKRLELYDKGALSTLYICFALTNYNSDYMRHYFDSLKWYKEIYLIAAEGARNHGLLNVPTESFFETKHILSNDINEQEKIAKFLSLIDQRIEKQRQLVENLKKYKRGLLNAIFEQKIRFKDANGNEFSEWENNKIKEKFKITRGYVLSTHDIKDKPDEIFKYPVFSSQTKNNGLLGYFDKALYKNAITWTTDGANAGFVQYRDGEFYCTNVCGVLIDKNGYNANYYIAEKLNSITKKHVSYVGNPKLMNNVMAEIEIPFPVKEEQEKLALLIKKINYAICYKEQILIKLQQYKTGLLQQMFI